MLSDRICEGRGVRTLQTGRSARAVFSGPALAAKMTQLGLVGQSRSELLVVGCDLDRGARRTLVWPAWAAGGAVGARSRPRPRSRLGRRAGHEDHCRRLLRRRQQSALLGPGAGDRVRDSRPGRFHDVTDSTPTAAAAAAWRSADEWLFLSRATRAVSSPSPISGPIRPRHDLAAELSLGRRLVLPPTG